MAPKCDIVVQKLISSDLIYFYLTQNISALAVYFSIMKAIFFNFFEQKLLGAIYFALTHWVLPHHSILFSLF